jgi:hypothetical protein
MAERTGIVNTSLIVYLCTALIVTGGISAFPVAGWASFVPSDGGLSAPAFDREADLAQLKTHLERRVVAQRLADWGLGPQEIASRLGQLSDAQIHQTVVQLDSVQPGGDSGLGVIVGLLVIAILVVVLLQLTGHRVVITK